MLVWVDGLRPRSVQAAVGVVTWQHELPENPGRAVGGDFYAMPVSLALELWPRLRAPLEAQRAQAGRSESWFDPPSDPRRPKVVGREEVTRDLAEILDPAVESGQERRCVLHGSAGAGKTALAYRLAATVCSVDGPWRPRNGCLFADAHAFSAQAPRQVRDIVMDWLRELRIVGGELAELPTARLMERLNSELRELELLIVIDNTDTAERLHLQEIAPNVPSVSVLATSRNRLDALDATWRRYAMPRCPTPMRSPCSSGEIPPRHRRSGPREDSGRHTGAPPAGDRPGPRPARGGGVNAARSP